MKRKLTKLLSVGLLCLSFYTFGQQKPITGKVVDSNGYPVQDAYVYVEGTDKGVYTDGEGFYTIEAKKGDTIGIEFIGFDAKTIKVKDADKYNVKLSKGKKAITLDEFVVVGYGKQKESEIAGSITTIKAKEVENAQTSNVVQSLTGKVGGVQISTTDGQPGKKPQVRFRGLGSLSSSNDPLYVVDGVPYNGDVNAISNQDIASITFLKDAAANALYGSRGANGVIIITTKQSKNKKISVTFNTKIGINTRAVPEYDVFKSPESYYEVFYQRMKLDKMYNDGATAKNYKTFEDAAVKYAIKNLIDGSRGLVYNIYDVKSDQLIDPKTGRLVSDANLLYHDDWEEAFFKPQLRKEYNLSVSGGNDRYDTYFSLGYLNDEGYVINSGFDRYSARLNSNYYINNNFKIGGNINYAKTIQNSPLSGTDPSTYSNVINWSRSIAPIYPIWSRNPNGTMAYDKKGDRIYDFGATYSYMGLPRPYGGTQNAYGQAVLNIRKNTKDNFSGRGYLSLDFLKDFNFTYNLGYDLNIGSFIRYGTAKGGDDKTYNGRIVNASSNNYTITNQQLLTWDKKIGSHKINILLGHESSNYKSRMLAGSKTNVVIPRGTYVSNASKYSYLDGYVDNYNIEGYFARLNYNFDNKYFLTGSFRKDGSSVFAPNKRWGNFYGIGGAWTASREEFLKGSRTINNLKFKVGYGEQGNDNLYYPQHVSMNHRSFFWFDRNYAVYESQYEMIPDSKGNPTVVLVYEGNKDLKWETSKNFNAGFEIGLLNRLNLDIQFFKRGVSDMLYNKPIALSTGTAFLSENIGNMENKGIEGSISFDILKKDNYSWNIYGNATHYENKVTKLPSQFNSGIFMFKEGLPAYTYYMRKFAGVDPENGDALWYKDVLDKNEKPTGETVKTNKYNEATLYVLEESANPKIYGGLGTEFRVKGWTLNVNFAYQLGGYIYDGVYQDLLSSDSNGVGKNYHKDVLKSWNYNNTNATLPAIDLTRNYQNGTSDMFLIKSDYISLQDVSLVYNLNKNYLPKGLENLTLGVYGTNLMLWSKRKGLDPRLMNLGTTRYNGEIVNKYGSTRTISFGVTAKF